MSAVIKKPISPLVLLILLSHQCAEFIQNKHGQSTSMSAAVMRLCAEVGIFHSLSKGCRPLLFHSLVNILTTIWQMVIIYVFSYL